MADGAAHCRSIEHESLLIYEGIADTLLDGFFDLRTERYIMPDHPDLRDVDLHLIWREGDALHA